MLYPQSLPPKEEWDCPTLVDIILHRLQPTTHAAYRESLSIGLRGAMAPIVIHAFGSPPREFALEGPKNVYVGRNGPAEVTLTIKRLYDHDVPRASTSQVCRTTCGLPRTDRIRDRTRHKESLATAI